MTAALPFDPPGGDNFDTEDGVPEDFIGYGLPIVFPLES